MKGLPESKGAKENIVKGAVLLTMLGLLGVTVPLTPAGYLGFFEGPMILTTGLLIMVGLALYGLLRGAFELRLAATGATIALLLGPTTCTLFTACSAQHLFPISHLWWAILTILLMALSGCVLIFGGLFENRWARIFGIAMGCGGVLSSALIVVYLLTTSGISSFPIDLFWFASLLLTSSGLVVNTFWGRAMTTYTQTTERAHRLAPLKAGIILNGAMATIIFGSIPTLSLQVGLLELSAFIAVAIILASSVLLLLRKKTLGLFLSFFGCVGAILLALPYQGLALLWPGYSVFCFLFAPAIVSATLCVVPMVRPSIRFLQNQR